MALDARSLAVGSVMCVRGVLNYSSLVMHWRICCIEEHKELSIYLDPRCSGFPSGWVYVHVGGGTHCCCCHVLFLTVCS